MGGRKEGEGRRKGKGWAVGVWNNFSLEKRKLKSMGALFLIITHMSLYGNKKGCHQAGLGLKPHGSGLSPIKIEIEEEVGGLFFNHFSLEKWKHKYVGLLFHSITHTSPWKNRAGIGLKLHVSGSAPNKYGRTQGTRSLDLDFGPKQ